MGEFAILIGHEVKPCNSMTWARWREAATGLKGANGGTGFHVADEVVADDVRISTVFLGLDHGHGGKPLWFETMVFGGVLDQLQERYATWDQAAAGHAFVKATVLGEERKAVDEVRAMLRKIAVS